MSNTTGRQHIVATDGRRRIITPRGKTDNMRTSINSVQGLAIEAVVLLECSPSSISEWRDELEKSCWLGEQIDVLAARKSKTWQDRIDAILLVNRRAGCWTVVRPEGNVYVR